MADEFDPCECVFNQFGSMQRLLSMMREGQSYCTDTECMDPPLSGNSEGMDGSMMIVALWMVLAMILFLVRPSSTRTVEPQVEKPSNAISNDDDQPPPPPMA